MRTKNMQEDCEEILEKEILDEKPFDTISLT